MLWIQAVKMVGTCLHMSSFDIICLHWDPVSIWKELLLPCGVLAGGIALTVWYGITHGWKIPDGRQSSTQHALMTPMVLRGVAYRCKQRWLWSTFAAHNLSHYKLNKILKYHFWHSFILFDIAKSKSLFSSLFTWTLHNQGEPWWVRYYESGASRKRGIGPLPYRQGSDND